MKKGTLLVLRFLARLAGFIVGGVAGYFLAAFAFLLAHGGRVRDMEGILMLYVALAGFFIGGVVGLVLAGKWVRAASQRDSQSGSGSTPPATRPPPSAS